MKSKINLCNPKVFVGNQTQTDDYHTECVNVISEEINNELDKENSDNPNNNECPTECNSLFRV